MPIPLPETHVPPRVVGMTANVVTIKRTGVALLYQNESPRKACALYAFERELQLFKSKPRPAPQVVHPLPLNAATRVHLERFFGVRRPKSRRRSTARR